VLHEARQQVVAPERVHAHGAAARAGGARRPGREARVHAQLRAERADHQRRGAQQAGQQREQRATRPHRRGGVRAAHFHAAKTLETSSSSSTASFAPVLG